GMRWSAHYDRAKGRKCWILVDASTNGHEAQQAQPNAASTAVETISSQIASLLGNLTGASSSVTPPATAPQVGSASVPRKPQGNGANAGKVDNALRADQRSIGEGHAAKRASPTLTELEREALFEEFLRWQETRQIIGTPSPGPAPR